MLKTREELLPKRTVPFINSLRKFVHVCCNYKRTREPEEWYHIKALHQMDRDLDIVKHIKRYRNVWNILKMMTTKRERSLAKM